MGQDPGAIREEIAATREQMSQTADAISDKLDARAQLRRRTAEVKDVVRSRGTAAKDTAVTTARTYAANPGLAAERAKTAAQRAQVTVRENPTSAAQVAATSGVVAAGFALFVLRSRRARPAQSRDAANDVVDLLLAQHRQIKAAFRRANRPGPGREAAFEHLVRLLSVHEAAEEAHVHPTLRRVLGGPGRSIAGARRHEEQQAKQMLTALVRGGTGQPRFGYQLRQLRDAVLAHADQEEREEFPELRRSLTPARLRVLATEVRLTQALAPTRPHPWVNTELANKLTAPVLGPLDRLRDAMRAQARS